MLPAHLAENIRQQVLYYLQSTFDFHDKGVERAFERFLEDPETGVFKGPWVHLRRPFRPAPPDIALPFDISCPIPAVPPSVAGLGAPVQQGSSAPADGHHHRYWIGKDRVFSLSDSGPLPSYPAAGTERHQGHHPLSHECPGCRPGEALCQGDLG